MMRRALMATCWAAAAAMAAGSAVGAATAAAAWGTDNQHQLVPAYFYPDWWNTPNNWFRMCDTMNTSAGPSAAVMNPASGPGTTANPDYARAVDRCHASGQQAIGYVHTSYGTRSLATVKAEIDAYYAFYPSIDGIFLDEMSNDASTVAYYQSVYAYVKAKPGAHRLIGNPGAAAPTGWQLTTPVADAVNIYEGTASDYLRWSPPSWVRTRQASDIVNLVFSAQNEATMRRVCSASKQRNAGSIYVTNDGPPNPWDTLPGGSYWTNFLASC